MSFSLNDLIGMQPDDAKQLLADNGVEQVEVVYNVDRKQTIFDKELVTAVRQNGQTTELVVCRYLFATQQ